MKRLLILLLVALGLCHASHGQGTFWFYNPFLPTRLGTVDGPRAGNNIFGQCLAGFTSGSLVPVEPPFPHEGGYVIGRTLLIPWAPGDTNVWIQMVAWDASVWGTSLAAVPENQLGKTDIVSLGLVWGWQPPDWPHWTQPAIVPPVPEPSVALLALLGAGTFLRRHRQRNRQGQ